MKKKYLKKTSCLLLSAICAIALTSCGNSDSDNEKETKKASTNETTTVNNETENKETENTSANTDAVNLRDMLDSLIVTDTELGLVDKYSTFADITEGSIDENLVGKWYMGDGLASYEFLEDGSQNIETAYGDNSTIFTCLTIDDYNVLCTKTTLTKEDENGESTEVETVAYTTYKVIGDTVYMTSVEDTTEEYINSSQVVLQILYKGDENGNFEEALKESGVAVESFAGSWEAEEGNIEIKDNTLIAGSDTFDLSFDDKQQLVATKDGESTTYSINLSIKREYDTDDRTKYTDNYSLGIYYEGKDENDVPNLVDVMQDWHKEFDSEQFYYSGNYTMK